MQGTLQLREFGDASTLQRDTREACLQSFAFFAQRVLGLRLSDRRCDSIQAWLQGNAELPASLKHFELEALNLWKDLLEGRLSDHLPQLARFLLAGIAA
jgi:hypothetical protein